MAKRRFEMHEYRQIIVRLRLGETIRWLVDAKVASCKKIRAIRKIAIQQEWLDPKKELPSNDVLAKFFKQTTSTPVTQSLVLPYQKQVRNGVNKEFKELQFMLH